MFEAICLCIFLLAPGQPADTAVAPTPPIEATVEVATPQETAVSPAPTLGGLLPKSNPWSNGYTGPETGSCGDIAPGSGWTGSLTWPTDSHEIDPERGFRIGHGAIDILAPVGSPVYAAESGLVIWAGWSHWGGGNMIVLAHGNTRQTHYAHLATVDIGCGEFVNRGETIGTVGQTGAASVPHLHFIVREAGYNYDPLGWLP